MTTLDNILSGQGDAVSDTPAVEENVAQTEQVEGQQAGDTEQSAEANQDGAPQGQKMVPHEALHAEKQKVRRYTDEVAEFRRSNENLQRQVSELMQRIPVPKQEPQQAPDWFENPEAATQHTVQQAVMPQFDQLSQTLMANAQIVAGLKYGDDKVGEAEKAFIEAVQSRALDPADYHKVVTSPNRYAAAVQWHQRQLAQKEIGDDPTAYRAKVEAEIREKVLAELQQGEGQQQTQQQPRQVMPSNLAGARNMGARSGPAWSGPPTLQDIFDRNRAG